MARIYLISLLTLVSVESVLAQYRFESKKAEKLYNKLEEHYANYDYANILDNEGDILALFESKQDTLTALMYSFLGESYYYELGDLQKGLAFYQKEYDLRTKLQAEQGFDFDMESLVYTYAALSAEAGNYTKAEELYLNLLKNGPEGDEEGYTTNVLGLADHYSLTGETAKGEELLRKNRRYIKQGTYEEAMSLKFLGDYREIKGEFSKAEKNYLEALDILEEAGYYPSLEYVYIMNSLGLLYINKSQYPLAEEVFNESLSILDRMGDEEESRAGIEFNLGQVYFELGLYPQAIDIYLRLIASEKQYYGEESFSVATTYLALGGVYQAAENHGEALTYLKAAEKIYLAIGETASPEYARLLNNLMNLYGKTGEYVLAREYTTKSLEAYKSLFGEDHHEYALSLSNAADVYSRLGEYGLASDYLSKAEKIRAKKLGKDHPMYALSTRKLAILTWKRQNLDDALEYYTQTFDNYFRQINTYFPILSEEEKSAFYYNRLKPTFEQFNSFIVKNKGEDHALIGEMYNYQLATKGLILYATSKVRQSILNSNDSTLIGKYDRWIEQKEQLAKLFSATELPLPVRNRKIDSLNELSNNLEKELSKASKAFAETFASKNYTWKDVQAKLKPGEAAVEVIRFRDFTPDSAGVFTDEVYYGALIVRQDTRDHPELVVMPNGKLMETRYLSNYRNAIKYKVDEDYSYRLFWKPIASHLDGIKKVYFSPDGVFNQISIYTLRNPDTGNFTLDELEIQLVTNTKDLLAFADTRQGSNSGSYLFGYPNYNLGKIDDSGAEGSSSAQSISSAVAEDRGRGARGGARGQRGERGELASLSRGGSIPRGLRGNLMRYMSSNELLALLPGTKKEVNLIDSLYQKNAQPATIYLSNEALEDSIKLVKNPKTLHIATHGFFLENATGVAEDGAHADEYVENPLLRSGLILAGANSFIRDGEISDKISFGEDGILTAYEAMNLNLDNTELVVLSACETGLGEVHNGEGVFGLQRAFQVAGAASIIMSMWTVDDDATQELMTIFYEEWLNGATRQEAFVKAQKRLKAKWKAPYYWGAFVMVGL